jgi:hypothetical protein
VDPRTVLDNLEGRKKQSFPCRDSKAGSFTPLHVHYTDYAIPVPRQVVTHVFHRSESACVVRITGSVAINPREKVRCVEWFIEKKSDIWVQRRLATACL